MPRKLKTDPQRQGKKRGCQGAGKSEHEDKDREKSESVHALAMTTVARKWLKVQITQSRSFTESPLSGVITNQGQMLVKIHRYLVVIDPQGKLRQLIFTAKIPNKHGIRAIHSFMT